MNFLSVLYAKAGITVDGVTTLNNTATGQTPATNDNSTKLATTGYVKNQNYYPYPTGTTSQYVRGDGSLATFTQTGGGGSSVSYYLNGSVSQGTIGGNAYYEMSKNAIIGTNADFNLNADGYIAQFVTDAGDPALLSIPGGNWNFEMFFSASSGGGSPSFYVELYKYDGTTLTLIASGSAAPEAITGGTSTDLYITALAVPTTTLTLTDRLAVRVYVNHSGRTITLHTQNGHLCQVITTFTTGLTALNGLTAQVQNFAVGAGGSDFNISSVTDTHTFNLPTASATKRGALSSIDWSAFDAKVDFGDLSATSPLSYNGSGVFSIAQSSTSTNGYLSSTDWTTFNNKIGGSGTANYIAKFTSGSVVGNSIIYDNGTSVGIGTATPTGKLEVAENGGGTWASANKPTLFISNGGTSNAYYALGIKTNSGEIFSVTNAGNVGIGTSSPGKKLDVVGTTDTSIRVRDTGGASLELYQQATSSYILATNTLITYTGGSERMRVDATGNVVIGAITPTATLDVRSKAASGSITAPTFRAYGYDTDSYFQVNNNASNSADIKLTRSDATTMFEINGHTGLAYFNGNVGIGTTTPANKLEVQVATAGTSIIGFFNNTDLTVANKSAIRVRQQTGTTTGFSAYLGMDGNTLFLSNDTTATNHLTISTIGNVGIGTSAPNANNILEVSRDTNAPVVSSVENANTGTAAYAELQVRNTIDNNTSSLRVLMMGTAYTTAGGFVQNSGVLATDGNVTGGMSIMTRANAPIRFYTNGHTNERMRLDASGNLLIGTTTDAGFKLDVNGTARVQGALTAGAVGTIGSQLTSTANYSAGINFIQTKTDAVDIRNFRIITDQQTYATFNIQKSTTLGGATYADLMYFNQAGAAIFNSSVTASSLIKSGGTASQYLMADGSTSTLTNPITGTGTTNYLPKFTGASALGDSLFQEGTSAIGLGVTPIAWNASFKALQIGTKTALWDTSGATQLSYNAYNDGANKYLTTGVAMRYFMTDSGHTWSTAASGTAGGALTFTSAMTLDASGQLGIGTTTPTQKLEVNGGVNVTTNNFYRYATDVGIIGSGTSISGGLSTQLGIRSSADILFATSGVNERMRITSAGNIGIGTATPSASALLEVATTGGTTSTILISGTTGQAQLKLLAGSGVTNRATRIDLFNSVASTTVPRWILINDYNQDGTNDFRFVSASATPLILTQAGAATFSSTITATQGIFTGAASDKILMTRTSIGSWNLSISGTNRFSIFDVAAVAERISITSAGDVGIGTTAPAEKLEVKGSTTGVLRLSSTAYSYNLFTNNADGAFYLRDVTNSANRLTISTTGAATFSSSVTATNFSGAGTGLTGTASGLSIGGSAGSAGSTTLLVSPNGSTVVPADSAMPSQGQSFIHTLAEGPGVNDGHILGMTWANTTTVYGAQIWLDTDPTKRMAIRGRSNAGVWTSWAEVLTDNNYSSYALPLSGGTMSGIITTVSNGTAINFSGQTDSFGYNVSSGLGTYIKGTGNTYLYGGGSFYDGTAQRVLLHAGNYNSYAPTLTGTGASGTWGISITGSSSSAATAGYTTNTSGGAIRSYDLRTIAPDSMTAARMGFGFTSFNNNNTAPWADYLHLRSYSDGSGGADNLVVFNKSTIGMRIYQQTWNSATPYSTYKDIAFTDGTNASGTWGISITGNANYATTAGALTSMNISQFTNNSGYLTSASLAGYLPLTGGTLSGDLTTSGWFINSTDNYGIKNSSNNSSFWSQVGGWVVNSNDTTAVRLVFYTQYTQQFSIGRASEGIYIINDQDAESSILCYQGAGYGGYLTGTWNVTNILTVAGNYARINKDYVYTSGYIEYYSSFATTPSTNTWKAGVFSSGDVEIGTIFQIKFQNSTATQFQVFEYGSVAVGGNWLYLNEGGTSNACNISFGGGTIGATNSWKIRTGSGFGGYNLLNNATTLYNVSTSGTHSFYSSTPTLLAQFSSSAATFSTTIVATNGDILGGSTTSDTGSLTLRGGYGTTAANAAKIQIRGFESGAATQGALMFFTNNTERFRISQTGAAVFFGSVGVTSNYLSVGDYGLTTVLSSVNGYFRTNNTSSYGFWDITGGKGAYTGILYNTTNLPHVMFGTTNGFGGLYYQTGSRWVLYYNYTDNCLAVGGTTTLNTYKMYVTGAIYATGAIVANSDGRNKENVEVVENALEKVTNLRGVTYTKKDQDSGKREMGVIAQEVEPHVPEVVHHSKDADVYGVSYGNFAGLFIEAIKEQQVLIKELKAEIEILKNK